MKRSTRNIDILRKQLPNHNGQVHHSRLKYPANQLGTFSQFIQDTQVSGVCAATRGGKLSAPAPKGQNTMTSHVPRKMNKWEKKRIDEALLRMFTISFQPFSLVEGTGFRNCIHAINPNYVLPSREIISSTFIPEQYAQRKKNMMAEVKKYAKAVCLTVESWTSIKDNSYLAVTAHFFKEEMDKLVLRNVLLHCEQFGDLDTPSAVASSLTRITEDWGVADKISFAVSENDTNIVDAFKLKGWPFYVSYVQTFNLIIQNSLTPVESIVSKVNKIVNHFKCSEAARETLIRYQSNFQKISQPLNVKKCDITRWNSVFYMLERFSQLREALQAIEPHSEYDLPVITTEEWEIIKQLCTVLKPFEEATTKMCNEKYLSASMAITLANGLKCICDGLKHEGFSEVVLQVLHHLQDGLELKYGNIEQEPALGLCLYLDPRFKEHAFKDASVAYQIRQNIIEQMNKEISTPVSDTLDFSIWAEFDLKIKGIAETIPAEQELDTFNKEPKLDHNSCPLEWWQSHGYKYPKVYKMFKENCHIVVASIPCERIFSKAGAQLSERRTCLSAKRTSELIFLNANTE